MAQTNPSQSTGKDTGKNPAEGKMFSIDNFDAKLSPSTIQELEVASANQIPISCLDLQSCSPGFDESSLKLTFQSGLSLSILSSLQELKIMDNKRKLTNEELAAILSYSSKCTSLKELMFGTVHLAGEPLGGYIIPETIPVTSIPSSLEKRKVKVWNFIAFEQFRRLNLHTGEWEACDDKGNLPGEEGFDEMSYEASLASFK